MRLLEHADELDDGLIIRSVYNSETFVSGTIPEKKRGMGAVICMCPMPESLRDKILQIFLILLVEQEFCSLMKK